MSDTSSRPADLIRARLAEADRLRRTRTAAGRLWRVAPATAALFVAVAIGGRLGAWAPLVTIGTVAVGTLTLLLLVVTARRPRPVSDAAAAEIDAHAQLNGELRSAHWFAQHGERDPWIDFHLSAAVERVQAIDWSSLYPAPSAGRAKLATAVLTAVALAVALVVVPARTGVIASTGGVTGKDATRAPGSIPIEALTPEMLEAIEDVLTAAETAQGGALTASQVRALVEQLERLRAQKQIGAEPDRAPATSAKATEADVKDFAERAQRASEDTRLQPEVREPLSEIAEALSNAAPAQNSNPKNAEESAAASDDKSGAAQSKGKGSAEDASAASVKEAAAGGGVGVIMMADNNPASSKDGGQGVGGGAGQDSNSESKLANLGAALRKETIEASSDNPGENVLTELRRKTGRGDASVGFTRSAGTAERGRSTAPPPVPESRRAAVKSYFVRTP